MKIRGWKYLDYNIMNGTLEADGTSDCNGVKKRFSRISTNYINFQIRPNKSLQL